MLMLPLSSKPARELAECQLLLILPGLAATFGHSQTVKDKFQVDKCQQEAAAVEAPPVTG